MIVFGKIGHRLKGILPEEVMHLKLQDQMLPQKLDQSFNKFKMK